MFNKNSGLVTIWVRLLTQDDSSYSIENVPNLSNLKEVVQEVLNERESAE